MPELDNRDWFFEVDCSKYTAYIIAGINHEMSVSSIIDPIKKIEALLEREWYFDVDCSKYTAYFIAAINHEMSVSSIIDPIKKIEALLNNRK